ncbi:hypothetical protein [Deinococcus soli (ex Cha et al. 2016)]|uniref:Uncharacterized protein n=2 Tax=Deinococcus soli (ex Cha et al. 2016) TaxID=1309411 RepID=A0ACC6KPV4_9DEIO|nr:hypothetical protein [Deinococcus soli (ex Cha et al. 2016)]MDR6221285.1 hypothetical protein [Deinococcus soli (ex Cha et al. 2016)]MDR6331224.1 hypothetical protein [Deinococcus soli (ex Cha et al. 2016)]MDR6754441.1 hypothetical protein [Deinococcus soli (ex Cha et al. 2016)]
MKDLQNSGLRSGLQASVLPMMTEARSTAFTFSKEDGLHLKIPFVRGQSDTRFQPVSPLQNGYQF